MTTLEILSTEQVHQTVKLGGRSFVIKYSVSAPFGAGPSPAPVLSILGVKDWEEAKRMLASIAAGLSQEQPTPPALPAAPVRVDGTPGENAALPVPVSAALLKAEKLRDVLSALHEAGVRGEAAVLAEVARIKPSLPVLQRIPNLEERVKRALVVLEAPA